MAAVVEANEEAVIATPEGIDRAFVPPPVEEWRQGVERAESGTTQTDLTFDRGLGNASFL